jgi:hypothetical protein
VTKALTAVGATLALALLVLGLVIYLNREEDAIAVDNLLAESITREIATAEQRGQDVDLADTTTFDWDSVLIADRAASAGDIARAGGAPWKGDLAFRTGDLLIFLRDGHVTRFADYRGDGHFEGIQRPVARFDRDDAVFSVRSLVIRPRDSATSSP